jgi:uncharacterized membrane protein
MARNRLVARDRMLLFGLTFGLLVGVGIGRKILSPIVVVLLVVAVFACAYFALRLTRDARDGSAHRHSSYEEEEYVEA